MTLDEAIKHCQEVADEQEKLCKINDPYNFSQPKWKECAAEHRQLAEWLKDYKRLKEQEPCADCVSRKDVEDMIFRMGSVEELEIDFAKLLLMRRELKKLPSVKPTAQKGRWVHHNDDHYDWMECSFCGYGDEGEVVYGNETPFCPMCGADLSEVSE